MILLKYLIQILAHCLVLPKYSTSVRVVGRGYNMYECDTESENTSSMIQDFVFLCQKIGSI